MYNIIYINEEVKAEEVNRIQEEIRKNIENLERKIRDMDLKIQNLLEISNG